jgi:hypothetical protein
MGKNPDKLKAQNEGKKRNPVQQYFDLKNAILKSDPDFAGKLKAASDNVVTIRHYEWQSDGNLLAVAFDKRLKPNEQSRIANLIIDRVPWLCLSKKHRRSQNQIESLGQEGKLLKRSLQNSGDSYFINCALKIPDGIAELIIRIIWVRAHAGK